MSFGQDHSWLSHTCSRDSIRNIFTDLELSSLSSVGLSTVDVPRDMGESMSLEHRAEQLKSSITWL